MKGALALKAPLDQDLSAFVGLLRRLGVPCRVSEGGGEQLLWVPDAALAEQVRELYQRYPEGDPHGEVEVPARPLAARRRLNPMATPMTLAVLLVTFAVAALTLLGDNHQAIRWLSFQDYRVSGDYAYFVPLAESLASGQWWRLFTPMLLHFGVLHLAMNSLWYWELGRRIERRQGSVMLLGLTLSFALVSNVAQYLFGGSGLFGGLSGVLFGLLGHCWLFQRLAPCEAYHLPRGVVGMMLAWLAICLSGVVGALGFGQIANAAHVGGLLAGIASGVVGGLLARGFGRRA